MSPFAALGLDDDADGRAVKRAYAARLKTKRPDEDPEGFQALNAAYKAALAAIRWRVPAATEATPEPEPAASVGHVDPAPSPKSMPPALVREPEVGAARPVAAPDALFDYASATDAGLISFDFDAFAQDLFAVTADPQANLSAWLEARMAPWPIAMKPTLAPHVLQALDGEEVAISPDHFRVIMTAFGLDDVLSRIDPLAVERLRAANERRFARWEAIDRARWLLEPGNQRAFDKAARVGGYTPFVAPLLARLVTGPNAARRTALRWIPPCARWLVELLDDLSANNIDALSPPIDALILKRWQRADRAIGWIKVTYVLVAAAIFYGVWLGIGIAVKEDPYSIAAARFSMIQNDEEKQPAKAIDDYAAFVVAYPPPRSEAVDDVVATAMFDRGVLLARLGRVGEAEASYNALDKTFGGARAWHIRSLVSQGLYNWSYLVSERKDYRAVLPIVRKIVIRYQGYDDEEKGEESFELQVAKATINEADALEQLGDRQGALALCRDFVFSHAQARTDAMRALVDTAHDIEGDYGVKTIVP